ncbi:tRNA(Met) cytidine acetyltransferase TmcA [Paraglaciecola sp. 2405UD69-4]|uniref:tRNA(Met) cytidine acetyltransferase TmcA n=1 Tax=Paraglaciecola sp. 2405UD69-4 TaxID=3391836 RepID=UPI0039C93804
MNSPSQLSIWFKSRNNKPCHRQLLVISGDRDWVNECVDSLTELVDENSLFVGKKQSNADTINIKDYQSKLGQEYNHLILDCFEGFRANAAIALSGTIKANGVMILLCPQFSDWITYPDPENANRISFGYNRLDLQNNFYNYLSSSFVNSQDVAILTEESFQSPICYLGDTITENRYAEQEEAIQLICKHALGRAHRPLLVTADRGRGKSSALGIAAASMMIDKNLIIWVTAPLKTNTIQIFNHAQKRLPNGHQSNNYSLNINNSSLSFKAIDEVLSKSELPDVLFLDEAAAIPIPILIKLLEKFPRIIFSTTSHGYEGSGRGFEVKFINIIKKLKPNYKRIHLNQPIRWYASDTLENFWFNTMFYNYKRNGISHSNSKENFTFRKISQAELLEDHNLLEEVFSLLLEAHYQTSPDDLQRLLDAQEQHCFALMDNDHVIGVVQIIEEGGECLTDMKEAIAECSRRFKGHLVCQQLASTYYLPELCLLRHWRISRIAITPKLQRQGLGEALIKHIEQQASFDNINLLSAAFGANTDIIKFWSKSKFSPVQISHKAEVSSGEQSCICIKAINTTPKGLIDRLEKEFSENFRFNLSKVLQNISTDIALMLLKQSNHELETYNHDKVLQFINGTRPLASCYKDIYLAVSSNIGNCNIPKRHSLFLTAFIMQNKSHEKIKSEFTLTGKKQIESLLRACMKDLILN